jgi:hypothetical protein
MAAAGGTREVHFEPLLQTGTVAAVPADGTPLQHARHWLLAERAQTGASVGSKQAGARNDKGTEHRRKSTCISYVKDSHRLHLLHHTAPTAVCTSLSPTCYITRRYTLFS